MNCTSAFSEQRAFEPRSRDGALLVDASPPEGREPRHEANPEIGNNDRAHACAEGFGYDFGRAIALMLVALGPALFWTALIAFAGKLLAFATTPSTLAGAFFPIFGFLIVACSPCFLRSGGTEELAPERSDPDYDLLQTNLGLVPSSDSREPLPVS